MFYLLQAASRSFIEKHVWALESFLAVGRSSSIQALYCRVLQDNIFRNFSLYTTQSEKFQYLKGATMKLKVILVSIVILAALFLSAFGSPAAPQTVKLQNTVPPATVPPSTVVPPAITVVPATVIVQVTPAAVPVTGEPNPTLWTIILFALLALLAIAFLVALFSPRTARDDIDRNPPPGV